MKFVRFRSLAVAIVIGAISIAAADSDSVIGYWRLIKSEKKDAAGPSPSGELEMKFVSGGTLIVKFRDQRNATNGPRIMVGKFTVAPPDRITMTLNSDSEEHYRFLFQEGELRMEHLDYPVTNTLRRLKAFSF